jgi:excisionase family DNA binding protein
MKDVEISQPDVLSVAEVAQRLGCARSTVYEAIRKGDIPAIHFSQQRVVVPRKAFLRMLEFGKAGLLPPADVDMQELAKALQQTFLQAQAATIDEMLRRLTNGN